MQRSMCAHNTPHAAPVVRYALSILKICAEGGKLLHQLMFDKQ